MPATSTLPLLLWWAIEAKVATDPEAVLALFEDRAVWDLPIVRDDRRGAADAAVRRGGDAAGPDRCARLLALAPGPDHVKRLMAGFEAAYAGRSLAGLPPELADALARYSGQSLTLGLRRASPRRSPKPCDCWPTNEPIAPSSSSSSRSWARSAGRRAFRSCCGSPASRPTTPSGPPP